MVCCLFVRLVRGHCEDSDGRPRAKSTGNGLDAGQQKTGRVRKALTPVSLCLLVLFLWLLFGSAFGRLLSSSQNSFLVLGLSEDYSASVTLLPRTFLRRLGSFPGCLLPWLRGGVGREPPSRAAFSNQPLQYSKRACVSPIAALLRRGPLGARHCVAHSFPFQPQAPGRRPLMQSAVQALRLC